MAQRLADDRRAGGVDAARRYLALLADDGVAADRAARRHRERRRAGRALLEQHANDLRDHVAALLDDDRVADADVLPREVLVVVERRALDRRARELDRVEGRDRRQRAGAADLDADLA